VTARAGSNIALVKYWGKRNAALNLPATGSLSMTLDTLHTDTTLRFAERGDADRLELNGQPSDPSRISNFLDLFRTLAKTERCFEVSSSNSFPTAAGLASSASAFAALAVAANELLELGLGPGQLSGLARQGSGSAARSIYAGFVEMARGERDDGLDSVALPLFDEAHWPLRLVIAVTSEEAKSVSSTRGMQHTVATSPYYPAWLGQVERDLASARQAITTRDFDALCEVAEGSALAMHASAMAARPGVIYFKPATLAGIEALRELKDQGLPVGFTIDAGPQLKAICLPEHEDRVVRSLKLVPGVMRVLTAGPGPGARIL
jgi:diphosphomevalonate decarboxylase